MSSTQSSSSSGSASASFSISEDISETTSQSSSASSSDTLSTTDEISSSETATLSPVWPETLSAVVDQAHPFYTVGGVPVFNFTGNQSLRIYPRLANGEDMVAGFYRHPQPPFSIAFEGPADIVEREFQCTLSLPCMVTVNPSYEWWLPKLLSVQYDNTYGPYDIYIQVVYKQGPAASLQFVLTEAVVEELTPMPEMNVRALDSDLHPMTYDKNVNITVYSDEHFVTNISVLTGEFTPPIADARPIKCPYAPSHPNVAQLCTNYTYTVNASTTLANTSITWGASTVTVVKCPRQAPPVLTYINDTEDFAGPIITFSLPFSMLRTWVPVECYFHNVNITVPANQSTKCIAWCPVPINATRASLVVDHQIDNSSLTNLDLPYSFQPVLIMIDNHTANLTNATWRDRLGCVAAVWVHPETNRPVPRQRFFPQILDINVTLTVNNGTHVTAVKHTPAFDVVERFDGWGICNTHMPGAGSLFVYNVTIDFNITVVSWFLDSTPFVSSAATSVWHDPNTVCRNRDALVVVPGSNKTNFFADRRELEISRAITDNQPWLPVDIFVDNSTPYFGIIGEKNLYIELERCEPPLRITNSRVVDTTVIVLRKDFYLDFEIFDRANQPPPVVLGISGCGNDTFPSAIDCHSRGLTPLTIFGNSFLPTYKVSFAFDDNPDWVPCQDLQLVSESMMICNRYPGFGTNGSVIMHAVVDGDTKVLFKSRGLLWFAPNANLRCPIASNGLRCGGRGTCDALTGTCRCYASFAQGYWAGHDCSYCNIYYNNSDGCIAPCPVDTFGAICSNRGHCSAGNCWCGTYWSITPCTVSCPGVGSPCSGHGVCDATSGICTCFENYGTSDCSACEDRWSGAECVTPCPVNDVGVPCSARGQCKDGACFCTSGYCGTACELLAGNAACDACPLPAQYGQSCEDACPGDSVTIPCSGHGTCSSGKLGTGVCLCDAGFGYPDCSTPCPRGPNLESCSGHGVCNQVDSRCMCERYFAGPACLLSCPVNQGLVCSGYGSCREGADGDGLCVCQEGYSGHFCNETCLSAERPCSGRGVCAFDGKCRCFGDLVVGFWAGSSCETCLTPWSGPECNRKCPSNSNFTQCSGHGECNANTLQCACTSSRNLGYWGGPDCADCADGYYGLNCTNECVGGACMGCSGHGKCNSGMAGTGQCECFRNATTGVWSDSFCSSCDVNYFGENCTSRCPQLNGVTCPNGLCSFGILGTGLCLCNVGYRTVPSNGMCLDCQRGYYGPTCQFCPSATEQPCSGQGTCDDGINGTGACRCTIPYAGSNCSFTCPVANGLLCGRGSCVSQDTCVCEPGFQLTNNTCTICEVGLWGPNCDQVCPLCAFGNCTAVGTCACERGYFGSLCNRQCPGGSANPCSNHGTCLNNGTCDCFQSAALGYFVGAACESCNSMYESTLCNVACPVANGLVCSGRGLCFNGACTQCLPSASESDTVVTRCGAACELINTQCTNNSCTLGFFGAPSCTSLCPGASGTNVSAACSGRGLCTGSGTCVCALGYYGSSCSTSCPAVNGVQCSGRGFCDAGVCICTGSFGPACERACAGGFLTPCNNRGTCSTTGVCLCNFGYFGNNCTQECPGGAATPCRMNGACSSTGVCSCNYDTVRGFYGGAECGDCASNYAGPKCQTPCPASRGVVRNQLCVCRNGFVGDDCSKACPVDLQGNPCSNLGTCTLVNGFARCSCNEGYFGDVCDVPCTISFCQQSAKLYRAQCNSATGACECLSSSKGYWSGAACDTCQSGFWGTECTLPCSCSGHGSCRPLSGECICFASSSEGFWEGLTCSKCRSGYIGDSCTFITVVLPALATAVYTNPDPSRATVPLQSLFDPLTSAMWSVDPVTRTSIIVLQTTNEGAFSRVATISVPSMPRWMHIRDNVTIEMLLSDESSMLFDRLGFQLVVLERFSAASGRSGATSRRALNALSAPPPMHLFPSLVTLTLNGTLCTVFTGNFNEDDIVVYCPATGVSIPMGATSLVMSSIVWVGLSRDGTRLIAIGSAKASGNWAYVTVDYVNPSYPTVARGVNQVTSARGTPISCFPNAATTTACLLWDPLRLVVVAVVIDYNVFIDAARSSIVVTDASTVVIVTAVLLDVEFDLLFFAANTQGSGSTMYLFVLSTMDPVTATAADQGGIVSSAQIDAVNRVVVLVLETDFSITIRTLSLIGIRGVQPFYVDEHGGAVITVQGAGFRNDGTPVFCDVSGSIIPATVLSTTTLLCETQAATTSSTLSCTKDAVNLIFAALQDRKTSNTEVGIYRATSALLTNTVTAAGNAGFGAFDVSVAVTVFGFGFVDTSGVAKCQLVRVSDQSIVFTTPVLAYVNSSAVVCVQPPTVPSATPTAFVYSHDGTYFSFTTMAPYIIVGAASGVNATASDLIIVAGFVSAVPVVNVFLVDAYGNKRLALETFPYIIRCSSLEPIVQIAGIEEAVEFTNGSVTNTRSASGVAVFNQVSLVAPVAGELVMNYFLPQDITWATTITFTVVPGPPARLTVDRSSSWLAGVRTVLRIVPPPVVRVTDAAGNVVKSSEAFARVLYTSATQNILTGEFNVAQEPLFAAADGEGAYVFTTINMRTVFDTDAVMVFSVGSVPQLRMVVPQEKCVPGTEYAVTGTFSCALCPVNSVCDGTSVVVVNPGFWRSAANSFEFYSCTPARACPGGTSCADGYSGTMCAACDADYGKSQGECVACLSPAINWVMIALLLLALFALVFYLSIFTMTSTCKRDSTITFLEKKQHNPFSVVIKLAISYLQLLTLIPYSKLAMPSWVKSLFSGSATASKFNPNLSFIGCLLASNETGMLNVVLLLIPVAVVACIAMSVAAAYVKTYRGAQYKKTLAEMNLKTAPRGNATTAERRHDLAVTMSCNPRHYKAIVATHDALLGEDNDFAPTFCEDQSDVHSSPEVSLTPEQTLQQPESAEPVPTKTDVEMDNLKKDFRQRVLNMTSVSVLVALFFLFPTIVEQCASMFSCRSLDGGLTKSDLTVLYTDPSVDCTSAEYKKAYLIAWGGLVGLGFGIPLLNYLLVQLLRATTCNGDLHLAKSIFFFSTGGYRDKLWFWETISMVRKMLLAVAMTILSDDFMRLLAGLWVLLISVVINISFRPWSDIMLSTTEITTLTAVAISYGLIELTFFATINSSDLYLLMVYLAVVIVNALTVNVLLMALGWSARKTILSLASGGGAIGNFFSNLQDSVGSRTTRIGYLQRIIHEHQGILKQQYPRLYQVAMMELAMCSQIEEAKQRLEATPGSPIMTAGKRSRKATPRLPATTSFSGAVLALQTNHAKHASRALTKSKSLRNGNTSENSSAQGGGKTGTSDFAKDVVTPAGTLPVNAPQSATSGVLNPLAPITSGGLGDSGGAPPRVTFVQRPSREEGGSDENEASVLKEPAQNTPAALASSGIMKTKASSWIEVNSVLTLDSGNNDELDDAAQDMEAMMALLKRQEGYTAMRLRNIAGDGETEFASEILDELFEAEREFFLAAIRYAQRAAQVSQVYNI